MDRKIGLVLEGGGLRGIFTSGVLDFFMERDLFYPYVIGVSMGACNACSYVSKQKGRHRRINTEYIQDKRYLGLGSFIKTGNLFGMDFIFEEIANRLIPFDYDTFHNSPQEMVVVATDCETGEGVYYNKKDHQADINKITRASSSLPLIAQIVDYEGKKLLDGGLADSIPVKRALADGCEKVIVVLTRHREYRKKEEGFKSLIRTFYRKYPQLIKTIENRYKNYNATLDYLEQLEREGRAMIIRPSKAVNVGRIERNIEKLEELYQLGYAEASRLEEKLTTF